MHKKNTNVIMRIGKMKGETEDENEENFSDDINHNSSYANWGNECKRCYKCRVSK